MRYRKNIFRDKTFLTMAGVTVLAVAAIAGGVMLNNSETQPETSQIADLNENNDKDSTLSTNDIAANNGATKSTKEYGTDSDLTNNSSEDETTTSGESEASENQQSGEDNVNEAGAGVSGFSFSADSTLVWPVETNDIIIDYSPDATVYFATLDKYKTSNAISIRSEVGTPVYAAASGTVCDIGYNEEIGNSISLDLGSDYTLQYGQIKDIQVSEGDVVSEGDLLCYVADPTKYYSVEGPNLYLKLTLGDTTVDPLDYLDFKE